MTYSSIMSLFILNLFVFVLYICPCLFLFDIRLFLFDIDPCFVFILHSSVSVFSTFVFFYFTFEQCLFFYYICLFLFYVLLCLFLFYIQACLFLFAHTYLALNYWSCDFLAPYLDFCCLHLCLFRLSQLSVLACVLLRSALHWLILLRWKGLPTRLLVYKEACLLLHPFIKWLNSQGFILPPVPVGR